jgi:CCR4-NOT transcription complex subunit 11
MLLSPEQATRVARALSGERDRPDSQQGGSKPRTLQASSRAVRSIVSSSGGHTSGGGRGGRGSNSQNPADSASIVRLRTGATVAALLATNALQRCGRLAFDTAPASAPEEDETSPLDPLGEESEGASDNGSSRAGMEWLVDLLSGKRDVQVADDRCCARTAARFVLLDLYSSDGIPVSRHPFLATILESVLSRRDDGRGSDARDGARGTRAVNFLASRCCCLCELSFVVLLVEHCSRGTGKGRDRRGTRGGNAEAPVRGLSSELGGLSTNAVVDRVFRRSDTQDNRQVEVRLNAAFGNARELMRQFWELADDPSAGVTPFSHASLFPLVSPATPPTWHAYPKVHNSETGEFLAHSPSFLQPMPAAADVVRDLEVHLQAPARSKGASGERWRDREQQPTQRESAIGFVPNFAVPDPPMFEAIGDENDTDVHWLQPSVSAMAALELRDASGPVPVEERAVRFGGSSFLDLLLWDDTMCTAPEMKEEAAFRERMRLATLQSLLPSERQEICAILSDSPQIVYKCGLTPAALPSLVEHNSGIAFECIFAMMQTPAPVTETNAGDTGAASHMRAVESSHGHDITAFLSALLTVDLSLQSMEVVTRLTSAVELPTEFVHLYVSNCLRRCEEVEDKYLQNRLVRLVCVVLQAFIQQGTLDDPNLFVEVQTFCIEFSKIREAAGLFKLLKSMETGRKM